MYFGVVQLLCNRQTFKFSILRLDSCVNEINAEHLCRKETILVMENCKCTLFFFGNLDFATVIFSVKYGVLNMHSSLLLPDNFSTFPCSLKAFLFPIEIDILKLQIIHI